MLSKIRHLLKPKPEPRTPPMPSQNTAALATGPADARRDELFEQARALQEEGQLEQAVELYGLVLEQEPGRAEAYYKRANVLNALGRWEPALGDYDRAIALNPSYTYAFCNRGSVLDRLGRQAEALASYDRAIALDPKDALTQYNRASLLKDLKRFDAALAGYEAAIAADAGYAEAYVNRGNVLLELQRHEAAAESFARAIELKPLIAEAFQGRGVSLNALKRFGPALADYGRAIALKPDLAALYLNRGNLLCELLRYDAAVADYVKATELDPQDADGFHSLGAALVLQRKLDAAVANFDKAIALNPSGKYRIGTRRMAKMLACDWDGLAEDLDLIAKGVEAGEQVCMPMVLAALADEPALLRSAAEIWVREHVLGPHGLAEDLKLVASASTPRGARSDKKIRVGYFSADLRMHPVGYLAAGLFEHHDRSRFEITGFALGPETHDAMRVRIANAFDRFVDVRHKTDAEVAALSRELQIDIAIDLNGFSESARTRIFALRAAPIQINFLGYPGTLGAGFMDYLIADGTVVPRAQQRHYAEKIVYLPDSFLPFDSRYAIADRAFSREELGLPSAGFVFCCLNNSYKILPGVFDRWMRILGRVEGSVLWLSQFCALTSDNLRKAAARRGIDERRLIFADRMASLPEHLARLRAADLFLDTSPYNAHATALDALWAGVPLLTYPGDCFASRVAASLLRTAGLHELVADSPADYERRAEALAADPAELGRLRGRLAQRATPLFDTARYTKNLETVYQTMYDRYNAGAAPEHINEHLAG